MEFLRPSLMQLQQALQVAGQIRGEASITGPNRISIRERILGDRKREFNWIRDVIKWRLLQGEQIKALLRRHALERGQTKVDLKNEPRGEVLVVYLDIEPSSETYYRFSQEKPVGAYLEFLQY